MFYTVVNMIVESDSSISHVCSYMLCLTCCAAHVSCCQWILQVL